MITPSDPLAKFVFPIYATLVSQVRSPGAQAGLGSDCFL